MKFLALNSRFHNLRCILYAPASVASMDVYIFNNVQLYFRLNTKLIVFY